MIKGKKLSKVMIGLAIAVIMLAAIMSPAYAAPSPNSQGKANQAGSVTSSEVTLATQNQEMAAVSTQGTPSLEVRYALVEAKVSLMIGVMNALIPLIPDEYAVHVADLSGLIKKLSDDMTALNTYVVANDTRGFNAYIKGTLHPDMLNASKTIKADTHQFKDWGVTKEQLKQLKSDTKQLKDEYNVGAHVSAVAKAKNDESDNTQAYLNKAGIKAEVKSDKAAEQANKAHGPDKNDSVDSEAGDT